MYCHCTDWHDFLLLSTGNVLMSQINHDTRPGRSCVLCKISNQWPAGSLRCKDENRCNYTGRLLTLLKWWETSCSWRPCLERLSEFMSSSIAPATPESGWEGGMGEKNTRRDERGREGGKRTNVLDSNKVLSQQILWPYINHGEPMGDVQTGPRTYSTAHLQHS